MILIVPENPEDVLDGNPIAGPSGSECANSEESDRDGSIRTTESDDSGDSDEDDQDEETTSRSTNVASSLFDQTLSQASNARAPALI